MKNVKLILGIFFLYTLISCGKDGAKLSRSIKVKSDGQTSHSQCLELDLSKNVLAKKNFLALFHCTGWSKEFNKIYEFLKNLPDAQYNHLLSPINRALFKNNDQRNKFIDFIQKKITEKEIDSVSKIMQRILSNKSLIDQYNDEDLQELDIEIPEKKIFNNLIENIMVLTKETYKKRSLIQKSIVSINSTPKVKEQYEEFLNHLAENILDKNNLFVKNSSQLFKDSDWMMNYFSGLDYKSFKQLIGNVVRDKRFKENLKYLKNSIQSNNKNCSEFNSTYVLALDKELENQLVKIVEANYDDFLVQIIELSQRFSLFNNICPYDDFNKAAAEVLTVLRRVSLTPGGYEFLDKLSKLSLDESNIYLLFDFVNSELFNSFGKLVFLSDQYGINFGKNSLGLLTFLNKEEYKSLSELLILAHQLQESNYLSPLDSLSSEFKNKVLNSLLKDVFLSRDASYAVSFVDKTNKFAPDIYTNYLALSRKDARGESFLTHLFRKLDGEDFRQQLIKFLDKDVFFKFIKILSQQNGVEKQKSQNESKRVDQVNTPLKSVLEEDSNIRKCLIKYDRVASEDFDFWYVLDNYPKECIKISENKTLAYYIFQWTINIDSLFLNSFENRFSYQYGMISPEMMKFYHSLMHVINTHLNKEEYYVKKVVTSIKNELFEKGFADVLNSSVKTLDFVSKRTNILNNTLNTYASLSKKKADELLKNLLKIVSFNDHPIVHTNYSCLSQPQNIGGNPCFKTSDFMSFTSELVQILKRDNGGNSKLYSLFSEYLFGKGVLIPFNSRWQSYKQFNLEEFVSFLFDMTSQKTNKTIQYRKHSNLSYVELNRAQRLEVVIREISFLNNFYGAFFMNKVSGARNYYRKVKSLKKNLYVMDRTSGLFISRGLYPIKARWAFKNIIETYDSLYELDYSHVQYDGEYRRYGDLIQSILTMVVKSSSYNSQDYSPFQSPKPDLVKGHNANFITSVTRLSLISQMGGWLRERFNNKPANLLEDKKFKQINKEFNNLIKVKDFKNIIEILFNHKNFIPFVEKITDEISRTKNIKIGDRVLNTLYNAIFLLSEMDKEERGQIVDKFTKLLPALLDSYPYLLEKKYFNQTTTVIETLDSFLSRLIRLDKNNLHNLFDFLLLMMTQTEDDEIYKLIKNEEFIDRLSELLTDLSLYRKNSPDHSGFMERILADKGLEFYAIYHMVNNTLANDNIEYFSQIIQALSMNHSKNKSNLQFSLEEIFQNKDKEVVDFLTDMFYRFSRVE